VAPVPQLGLESSFLFSGPEFDRPKWKRLPDYKTRVVVVAKFERSVPIRSAEWNPFAKAKAIERTSKVCEFDQDSDAVLAASKLAGKYSCRYPSHRFCNY
jgi:hypothetical protein